MPALPSRLVPVILACLTVPTFAAEPLPARIDALIDAKAKEEGVPLSPIADDGEFLRRVWLDLAGTVPPADVTRKFLDDKSPDKRTKQVDALIAAPTFAPRMAELFHLMLMERLGDSPEWKQWLTTNFAENVPWDVMAAKMLRADPKEKGPSFFLAKRLENYGQNPVDYSALTRDVGRLFLGKDFRCCECHDHIFIEDYKQKDFQGLHAFFKNTALASPGIVAEKPTVEKTKFASVFTKVEMLTAPSVPGGVMVEIPAFAKGKEFETPPDPKTKTPGVLKFSTLAAAASRIATAENPDFVRNAVNRIWFAFLGRGLVHPLDLSHSHNPASHPEVLDLLAAEFVKHRFDVRWLIGEIVRTKVYQRSSRLPVGVSESPTKLFRTAIEKRLSAEQLFVSVSSITGEKLDAKSSEALRVKFVKAFANQPREAEDEVTPSLKAALFVLHDEAVLAMLKAKPGNLVERVTKLTDDVAVAEELYLAVLTRRPSAEESATVAKVLAKHGPAKRAETVGKLAWALLASAEFGVNH
jgi:hypothetical protein